MRSLNFESLESLTVLNEVDQFVDSILSVYILFDGLYSQLDKQKIDFTFDVKLNRIITFRFWFPPFWPTNLPKIYYQNKTYLKDS